MPYKDPEKRKQYAKEYQKKYYKENKDIIMERTKTYRDEYNKSSKGIISTWKFRGIIFHDYELLYDIYINTTHCDVCKCELNKCTRSRKCVDHDHSITDTDNVRNILCNVCNSKRRY